MFYRLGKIVASGLKSEILLRKGNRQRAEGRRQKAEGKILLVPLSSCPLVLLSRFRLVVGAAVWVGCFSSVVEALPPPEDMPEEILRTEIITEARSPIDGKLLSAAEYAELIASLQLDSPPEPMVSSDIKYLLFLLRLRSQIRLILPFLDFSF